MTAQLFIFFGITSANKSWSVIGQLCTCSFVFVYSGLIWKFRDYWLLYFALRLIRVFCRLHIFWYGYSKRITRECGNSPEGRRAFRFQS